MFLNQLSLLNFRNVVEAEIRFTSRVNCFVGGNGAGKTNLLEAIHYLSMCKGSQPMTDAQSIRHGEDHFMLDGLYTAGERRETVVCSYRRGEGKVLRRGGKVCERLSEHIGMVPVVMVSPADEALVNDAAEERRRWMNSFVSQLDKAYMTSLMRYNAILVERNKLLKLGGGELLDILDMQLSEAGTAIWQRRAAIVQELEPLAAYYYMVLSGDAEQVSMEYKSALFEQQMGDILVAMRERDLECGFTCSGIHRDDLVMKIGGYPLRRYGSQGQQKSFLVALKLAQYAIVAGSTGRKPLLLLDDLFDKLDMTRVERLLGLVSGDDFGQIFITDCNKVRLVEVMGGREYETFDVSEILNSTLHTPHSTL